MNLHWHQGDPTVRMRWLWLVVWALLLMFLFSILSSCASSTPMTEAGADGWTHFGVGEFERGDVFALGALDGDERNAIVEGVIVEVCPNMGCWMWVEQDHQRIFVRFQDYAFFVPKASAGKKVVMHGMTLLQTVSVDELRHYAQDAGASEAEIAAITEPQDRVNFYADSVYIEGNWVGAVDPDMVCEEHD